MRSLAFMRIERTIGGWRAWDVVQPSLSSVVISRQPYETRILPTLAAAKAYCEVCVKMAGAEP
jgi:hypothetical protein